MENIYSRGRVRIVNPHHIPRLNSQRIKYKLKTIDKENLNFSKIIKVVQIIGLLSLGLFIAFGLQQGIFTSKVALKAFINSMGIFAPVGFVMFQVAQVVVPVLPGGISNVIGVEVFGNLQGFLYNYLGNCLGSIAAFLLARKFGMKLVRSMAKPKVVNKYVGWLDSSKFSKLFTLAIFAPVAPDDFLCYLAGITKMDLKKFTLIILLGKPLGVFLYTNMLQYFVRAVVNVFI